MVPYSVSGIGAQMLKYRPNISSIKSIRLEAYQMSTMKKRIPMFLLALAMMVAMALPTFAASPPYSARVWIYNCENSMPNLNAACESQPTDHTNVTMWSNTNSDTQRWDLRAIDTTKNLCYIDLDTGVEKCIASNIVIYNTDSTNLSGFFDNHAIIETSDTRDTSNISHTQAHGLAGYEFAAVQFPAGGSLSLFPAALRPGYGAVQEIPPQYSYLHRSQLLSVRQL